MLDGWIDLDRFSRIPLAEQLYRQVREAVRAGRIASGTVFPSSRALAERLGVSRNTINGAYELLRGEAIITGKRGAAPILAGAPPSPPMPARSSESVTLSQRGAMLAFDRDDAVYHVKGGAFRPGRPDPALFPRDIWARSLRRAARSLSGPSMLYDNAGGLPALRTALSRYLAEARGVTVAPDDLLILPTVQSALAMLATCLLDPGDAVWLEDPGYLGARAAFSGARIDPLPVDADGANPDAMIGSPRLIYVTPSHQYPTGARMTLPRRLALLATARRHKAIVLEDDYDSEFLWQGRPIPALQALSGAGEVVYLGTVAKSLLPGLRLAYVAAPHGLSASLGQAQLNLGLLANVHAQAAFADFIEGGHYRTHLNRISMVYAERAATLAEAIERHCGAKAMVAPSHGGLQLMVRFDPAVDDIAVARHLAGEGYSVPWLSGLSIARGWSGLIVGFAGAGAVEADRFARCLVHILSA